MKYIRPNIYGGFSECSSPDDKVGYGRCRHMLGYQGSENIKMQIDSIQRGMYHVEVNDTNLSKTEQKTLINNYFNDLPTLEESKIEKIVNELNI